MFWKKAISYVYICVSTYVVPITGISIGDAASSLINAGAVNYNG